MLLGQNSVVWVATAALAVGVALWADVPASQAAKHWAFEPIARPVPPPVKNTAWTRNAVDRFVLEKLEKSGLSPSPAADRRTLIRRVYFDLIGLPPTYEQTQAFVNDASPAAWVKVVDGLLDSPHYGPRWGRHWLDVARYSDTMGYNFTSDPRYPFAWTYRDYVVDAFNADKPYDRFVMEQIAADWMDVSENDNRAMAAMGFLTVGRRFDFDLHSIIDDRIDVVTRGLMGLTVQCARCHDHKYDPITSEDYYALYGVFRGSSEPETHNLPVITLQQDSPVYQQFLAELARREQAVKQYEEQILATIRKEAREKAGEYLASAVKNDAPAGLRRELVQRFRAEWQKAGSPPQATEEQKNAIVAAVESLSRDEALPMRNVAERNELQQKTNAVQALHAEHAGAPPRAMVMMDADQQPQAFVFKRGQANNPGPFVPKRFLSVLAPAVGTEPFKSGSGRIDLARAIVHPENPLTARVMVNRLWQHHFGQGLVRTASDFGTRGEPPTHPELLDFLATKFMGGGWSAKKLHREILLSATYQQASLDRPDCAGTDPENRLLWKQNRRRLEFEPTRDSMLFVAGRLSTKMGGRGTELVKSPYTDRRSVYGYIDRQFLSPTLRSFDFASPDSSSPGRPLTTVPQQALFMMNGPFVADQARQLIARADVQATVDVRSRVELLYRILFARDPSKEETEIGLAFVNEEEALRQSPQQVDAWQKYGQALMLGNEFVFVD